MPQMRSLSRLLCGRILVFYKTREGFCKKSRGIVNECDACGLWKKAPPAAVATEEIDTLMKDFAALQILYQATEETSSP